MPKPANINWFVFRPCCSTPPLCTRKELRDGTYNFGDLLDFHEALDLMEETELRLKLAEQQQQQQKQGGLS
jgi:hypothetical protein